jgi:hypothetical protein
MCPHRNAFRWPDKEPTNQCFPKPERRRARYHLVMFPPHPLGGLAWPGAACALYRVEVEIFFLDLGDSSLRLCNLPFPACCHQKCDKDGRCRPRKGQGPAPLPHFLGEQILFWDPSDRCSEIGAQPHELDALRGATIEMGAEVDPSRLGREPIFESGRKRCRLRTTKIAGRFVPIEFAFSQRKSTPCPCCCGRASRPPLD